MVLSEFVGAVVRRWYVALVGLLLTAGLAYMAASAQPPVYQARGLVVLLPPQEAVGPGGNPFLGLDGLDLPARVVVAYFGSAAAQADIAAAAPGVDVGVTMEESTRGPVIAINASSSAPGAVIKALQFVAGAIPSALDHLQDEVAAPKNSQIRAEPLTMDQRPKLDRKRTIRLIIFTLGLGLAGTGFLTFSLDGMIRRRSAVRQGASAPVGRAEPAAVNARLRRQPDEPDGDVAEVAEIAEIGDHRPVRERPARPQKAVRKRG
jgi:hypothetical protein